MSIKKLIIIIIILFNFCFQITANGLHNNYIQNNSYNENTFINNNIVNFELSNEKKVVLLKKLGFSGIILSSSGTALFIPGIILLAVSYTKNGIHFANANRIDNSDMTDTEKQEARGIFISGAILFCTGIPVIVIGLSLLVTGYVFAYYYENIKTAFIENDGKNIIAGYSFKF